MLVDTKRFRRPATGPSPSPATISAKGATLPSMTAALSTPYPGHSQFQEGIGLFFAGARTNFGKVTKGEAAFGLAKFVIR